MPAPGWKHLLRGAPWFQGPGKYPLPAYSEFMPPPRLGQKPYGAVDRVLFDDADPYGWHVTEYEEAFELRPGLAQVAGQLVSAVRHLGRKESAHGISKHKLHGNPFYPESLYEAGAPPQERYAIVTPLALARTQDDKGRIRWTLFGGSEQGPGRAFWRGLFTAPGREAPAEAGPDFFRRLLAAAYDEPLDKLHDLRRAGLRIHVGPADPAFEYGAEEPLPRWTDSLRWNRGQPLRGVKYLFTFCAFSRLPANVQKAYLAGDLCLLPFPGSLAFWGAPTYVRLREQLPLAMQIPLLHSIERHEAPWGLRVPQSGWMHEPTAGKPLDTSKHGPFRNTFQRTNRWARVHRHQNELAVTNDEDKVAHVLFSTAAHDLGLYGKPMARNSQIWTHDFQLLLDGPQATRKELAAASAKLEDGGLFGYRFLYPAMQVGRHKVFWQRPLVAFYSEKTQHAEVLSNAPLGYMTAYRADNLQLDKAVELWPRLLDRPEHQAAVRLFKHDVDHHCHQTTSNIRRLLDAWNLQDRRPLERAFARQMLLVPNHESLDDWLDGLPRHSTDAEAGKQLADHLRACLEPESPADTKKDAEPAALTFEHTARRDFETAYWKTISKLAHGKYINKDNADCVLDRATENNRQHQDRDLEALGDYVLAYYDQAIEEAGMQGKAIAGELPFKWRTDFDFHWSGGWKRNQEDLTHERDLVVIIPGRDRRQAVIMADHYDTAYMEDTYGYTHGGHGPRLSAAGADDNHSATATLMLGAKTFMELSKAGQLACDVWLVHLTGEEFPADCLGARYLCQSLIEGRLAIRTTAGKKRDLSPTKVRGVYVLDMVAHNNDRVRDVFQICPGASSQSLWLAYQAHTANRLWNAAAPLWNARGARRQAQRGVRAADGKTLPKVALHPQLSGEVRLPSDPRSTLYNTDGQIFSDAGVPVVLFMENYDINRQGYHDTHDTMENIDLDYGAAVAAIAIESVARAAAQA